MPPFTASGSIPHQVASGQHQFNTYLQHQSSDIILEDGLKVTKQAAQQRSITSQQRPLDLIASHRLDVKTHVFKKEQQEYVPTRSEDRLRIETIIYVELSVVKQDDGSMVRNYDYVRFPKELFFNLPDKVMTQEVVASKRVLDVKAYVQSPSNDWRVEDEACMRCARRMSTKLDENESRILHILPELYRTEDGDGLVNFRSGVANIQLKINCYCGHKKEQEGFVVRFDPQADSSVGPHITTPLMFYHQNKNRIASRELAAAEKARKRAEKLSHKHEYSKARNVNKAVLTKTKRKSRNGGEKISYDPFGNQHIPTPPSSLANSPAGYSTSPELQELMDFSESSSIIHSPPQQDPMTSLFPEISTEPTIIEQQPQQPSATVSHMTPNTGPTRGGTLVTIHGSGFTVGEMMYVFFGETFVPVIPQHVQMIECFTPARAKAESVAVIALHSTATTNPTSNCMFTYVDDNEKELVKLALQRIMNISARMEGPLETVMQRANELAMWSELLDTSGLDTSASSSQFSSLEKMVMGSLKMLDTSAGKNSEGLSIFNSTGHTMLHLSVALHLGSLVKDLVERGIDMSIKDKNGLTALDLARLFKDTELIDALSLVDVNAIRNINDGKPESSMQPRLKPLGIITEQHNDKQMEFEWESVRHGEQENTHIMVKASQNLSNIQRNYIPGTGWMNAQIGGTSRHNNIRDEFFRQDHDRLCQQEDICNELDQVNVPLAVQAEFGQAVAARRRSNSNGGSVDAANQAVVQSSRRDVESEPVLFLGGQPVMRRVSGSVLSNRQENDSDKTKQA
ncbi:SPT3 Dosage dependent suppressor of Ty-induced promoter mutations-like protein [Entomortierella beljakovae]|nr:SPT3 Dosage dependent suppressor of Ty-induced promoter mutations-like protein [Entomortierella beljakovae]